MQQPCNNHATIHTRNRVGLRAIIERIGDSSTDLDRVTPIHVDIRHSDTCISHVLTHAIHVAIAGVLERPCEFYFGDMKSEVSEVSEWSE